MIKTHPLMTDMSPEQAEKLKCGWKFGAAMFGARAVGQYIGASSVTGNWLRPWRDRHIYRL